MKSLAFIDMDDTLLGPDKTISSANRRAIADLRAAGVEIVIASGRHHLNLAKFQDDIGGLDWLISSHGSVVESLRTGEILQEHSLPQPLISELCVRARQEGVGVIAYHRTGAYVEEDTKWSNQYAERTGWTLTKQDFATLPSDHFQKIMWTSSDARLTQLDPIATAAYQDRVQVLRTEIDLLEFFPYKITKDVGARTLATSLGVPLERTLAFGDGNNDIELLRWAGISVAMAHGREGARKAARFISPPAPPEDAFAAAVGLALQHLEEPREAAAA